MPFHRKKKVKSDKKATERAKARGLGMRNEKKSPYYREEVVGEKTYKYFKSLDEDGNVVYKREQYSTNAPEKGFEVMETTDSPDGFYEDDFEERRAAYAAKEEAKQRAMAGAKERERARFEAMTEAERARARAGSRTFKMFR